MNNTPSGDTLVIPADQNELPTKAKAASQTKDSTYLPSFWGFAATAAIANAPLFGWLLFMGSVRPAFSIAVGLATGLVVYGSLHLFVNRGLDMFLTNVHGNTRPESGLSSVIIAMLLPLKYLVIGFGLYELYSFHTINVAWVTVGFAITQVAVVSKAVKRLKSMPLA